MRRMCLVELGLKKCCQHYQILEKGKGEAMHAVADVHVKMCIEGSESGLCADG